VILVGSVELEKKTSHLINYISIISLKQQIYVH
jgi:hypothetical protein